MVDFAALNAAMKADRERLAAMTPEARAEEEARERAERDAAFRLGIEREEDARLFQGRTLREESLIVKDSGGRTQDGGSVFYAENAKGPVRLVLPEGRADEMNRGSQQAAGEALNRAFLESEAMSADGRSYSVPVVASGVFRSYAFKDSTDAEQKRWEFVVARMSFTQDGQTHTIGRDVHPPQAKKEAAPAAKAADKGVER